MIYRSQVILNAKIIKFTYSKSMNSVRKEVVEGLKKEVKVQKFY